MSVEFNAGQMVYDIRLAVNGKTKVEYFGRMGGNLPTPNEVETALVQKLIGAIIMYETVEKVKEIIKPENLVYSKSPLLNDVTMHYCPGCSHGVVHKLIAEVIEELGIQKDVIGVSPVGCAVFAYNYIDIDWSEAAHGRAPAVATGIKRVMPEKRVFTYQGDGDLAAIGTAETMHAVNRGENLVMIFINNAIYGMTGGQMAPTTMLGQITSTTPYGRNVDLNGYPLRITELLAQLPGAAYVTRQSVHTPAAVRKSQESDQKSF